MTPHMVNHMIDHRLAHAMWADERSRHYARLTIDLVRDIGRGSANDKRVQRYAGISDRMFKIYNHDLNEAIGWASR